MLPFAKLAPFAHLLDKQITDLTPSDIDGVLGALGVQVNVTDELRSAGLALLQGRDINSVADMIQSPESVQQLVAMFARPVLDNEIAFHEVSQTYGSESAPVLYVEPKHKPKKLPARRPEIFSSPVVGWRYP